MRALWIALLGFCGVVSSGCAMCSPGFLDDYATVGGKWERSDPTTGRVGSIFSDPNAMASEVHPSGLVGSEEGVSSPTTFDESAYYPSDRVHYEDSEAVMLEDPGYEEYEGEGIIILGDQW